MRRLSLPAIVCVVGFVGPSSVRAQLPGVGPDVNDGPYFGFATAELADLNGDGVPECAIASPSFRPPDLGEVWIYSGRDGSVVRELTATNSNTWGFGTCIRDAHDVDGDGTADILVQSGCCTATVFSGRDGHAIWTVPSSARLSRETWLSGLAESDGDGHAEFVADDVVYSGATGAALFRLALGRATFDSHSALAEVGDIDADGVSDLAVLANVRDEGRVYLCSGRDGHCIRELFAPQLVGVVDGRIVGAGESNAGWRRPILGFSRILLPLGDVDCDGVSDLAIECTSSLAGPSRVHVISGGTGVWLGTLNVDPSSEALAASVREFDGSTRIVCASSSMPAGFRELHPVDVLGVFVFESADVWNEWEYGDLVGLQAAGDIDRDGTGDVMVSIQAPDVWQFPGYVRLCSGRDGHVIRRYDTISSLQKLGKQR